MFPIRKTYMDDIIDNYFDNMNTKIKCDVYEKDGVFYLIMDMPGFCKEDINILYDKGVLEVTAEKSEEVEDTDYIYKERNYGKLSRTFSLGDIVEEEIKANLTDGVLTITVPKKKEETSKKVINID